MKLPKFSTHKVSYIRYLKVTDIEMSGIQSRSNQRTYKIIYSLGTLQSSKCKR